ncbi:LysR family transcriptional regulator [Labrys miyagiensis]
MIDIRQMRYFVTLAETLHFGRAAERLHLTQPPLTRQIAALEKELGVRLLERHSRQARLTPAGTQFLQDARTVLATFEQACDNARLADRGELGRLSIGFMMHAAHTIVPRLARRYMADHPGVELKLREVIPNVLIDDVLAGRHDVGVVFPPGHVRGLEARVVHREKLCVALYPGHPLAAENIVAPADLEGLPLIATPVEISPALRDSIVAYCRSAGFLPEIRLETQLQQTIVSLVAEELGIALVPESMRRSGIPNVVYRDLSLAPSIEHVLIWRRGNLNPALPSFLALAEEAMA